MEQHYKVVDGKKVYGKHVLLDLYGASRIDDVDHVKAAIRAAVEACGAVLLSLDAHDFGVGSGVTSVAMLSESHVSFHSWPETGYAAIDMFTCGTSDPLLSVPVFEKFFTPESINVETKFRGE